MSWSRASWDKFSSGLLFLAIIYGILRYEGKYVKYPRHLLPLIEGGGEHSSRAAFYLKGGLVEPHIDLAQNDTEAAKEASTLPKPLICDSADELSWRPSHPLPPPCYYYRNRLHWLLVTDYTVYPIATASLLLCLCFSSTRSLALLQLKWTAYLAVYRHVLLYTLPWHLERLLENYVGDFDFSDHLVFLIFLMKVASSSQAFLEQLLESRRVFPREKRWIWLGWFWNVILMGFYTFMTYHTCRAFHTRRESLTGAFIGGAALFGPPAMHRFMEEKKRITVG